MQQNGTIIADGTLENPIIFTSALDDDHGCDNNDDGGAIRPAAEDWGRILVATNGNVFNNCHFYYGGNNTWHSTLETRSVDITISNCVFAHNAGGSYSNSFYGVLTAWDADGSSVITGNTFYDNILPLAVNASINLGTANSFSNPLDEADTNRMNGIFVYGDIDNQVSWEETEVPFVSETSTLFVRDDWHLSDGVIVKVTDGNGITIRDEGEMYFSNQVIFTSFKDDAHGGDTNGDGDITSPLDGDWEGIWDPRIPGNTFYLEGPNILYAQFP